jgi:hypothetical protein
MSLIDELRSVKSRVADRLRELEPLVAEYHELVKEAERLGINTERAEPAAPAPRRPARGRSRQARTPKAAAPKPASPSPDARDKVIASVASSPGVTVAEVAKGLGVEPTSLYRVVREMTDDGTLKKRGRQLFPPE